MIVDPQVTDARILSAVAALAAQYPGLAFGVTLTRDGNFRLLAQNGGRFAEQVFQPRVLERKDAAEKLAHFCRVLVISVTK